jgi:hypothetical protein
LDFIASLHCAPKLYFSKMGGQHSRNLPNCFRKHSKSWKDTVHKVKTVRTDTKEVSSDDLVVTRPAGQPIKFNNPPKVESRVENSPERIQQIQQLETLKTPALEFEVGDFEDDAEMEVLYLDDESTTTPMVESGVNVKDDGGLRPGAGLSKQHAQNGSVHQHQQPARPHTGLGDNADTVTEVKPKLDRPKEKRFHRDLHTPPLEDASAFDHALPGQVLESSSEIARSPMPVLAQLRKSKKRNQKFIQDQALEEWMVRRLDD